MAHFSIGLVHYPIYNKHGDIITTALTNYDIHDLARSATTYGVENYYIIHPNFAQRKLAEEIMEHWQTGFGSTYNPDRKDAFAHVKLRENLAQVREEIHRETGHPRMRALTPTPSHIGRYGNGCKPPTIHTCCFSVRGTA